MKDIKQYNELKHNLREQHSANYAERNKLDMQYAKAEVVTSRVNSLHELYDLQSDDIDTVVNTAKHELRLDSSPTNPFRSDLTLSREIVATVSTTPTIIAVVMMSAK